MEYKARGYYYFFSLRPAVISAIFILHRSCFISPPDPFKRDRNIVPGIKVGRIDFYCIRVTFECQGILPLLGQLYFQRLSTAWHRHATALKSGLIRNDLSLSKAIGRQPVRTVEVRDKDEKVMVH